MPDLELADYVPPGVENRCVVGICSCQLTQNPIIIGFQGISGSHLPGSDERIISGPSMIDHLLKDTSGEARHHWRDSELIMDRNKFLGMGLRRVSALV
jgi:hypothetical protein